MDDLKNDKTTDLLARLSEFSSPLDSSGQALAVILAAGHGKRIRSNTSKMLHEIWGRPTVTRVADAAQVGLDSPNQVVVVGIKALQVTQALGRQQGRAFVLQQVQNGTGHAVSVALNAVKNVSYGDVYIFAGDMGLMTAVAVKEFKQAFVESGCDMMVLTGTYEGPLAENYYGRIVRVPAHDIEGVPAGDSLGKVVEIKEHKDILALPEAEAYQLAYRDRIYGVSKRELLDNREFNSGIFAFKSDKLNSMIGLINTDNVQGELYVTDLISIFNKNGLSVGAFRAQDNRTVLGFNTKSVLREMNDAARAGVYERLKDIVSIEDRFDFFIDEEVVDRLVAMDQEGPLDIFIGKGAFVAQGVILARGAYIGRGARVEGAVTLGTNCRVGAGTTIVGTRAAPTTLGNNVTVKGRSTIRSCEIADAILIEHSFLENKTIGGDGTAAGTVRFVWPPAEGTGLIHDAGEQK